MTDDLTEGKELEDKEEGTRHGTLRGTLSVKYDWSQMRASSVMLRRNCRQESKME